MKTRKYFQVRMAEHNPMVIIPTENRQTGLTYETKQLIGKFTRVMPSEKDHAPLCLMQHRFDKFAPASGNGVILTNEILKQLDA
jgi:hypothetical protein